MELYRLKPHFFKVLIGNFSYRLRIPPAFLKNLSEESSDEALLLDLEGGRWNVKIDKININNVYFDEGWKGFVEYHCLKEGYFLVFKYLGNMHFTVEVFDTTHCSIQYFCNLTKPVSFKKVEKRFEGNSFHPHSSLDKAQGFSSKKRPIDSSTHASKTVGAVKIEENDHSSFTQKKQRFVVQNSIKGSSEMRTQKTHSPFQSKNPSFRKQMKGYNLHRGILLVPLEFAKAHISSKSSCVELWNGKGQSWSVNYLARSYHGLFSAGWKTFVRGNGLQVGDECTFEVVDDKVIHVHVTRNSAQY